MSIPLSSNFDLVTQLPLDARTVAADAAARDAIPSIQRYEGLLVFTFDDKKTWQLRGGITNSDWVEFLSSGDANIAVDQEGTQVLATIGRLDFRGSGVTVEDGGSGRAIITIEGGGGQAEGPEIFGACDDPLAVAATGLRVANDQMNSDVMDQITFVQGDGGAVIVTADPPIEAHNFIGAILSIVGKSNTNTLKLVSGPALWLNGDAELGENYVLRLIWRGDMWVERRRNF